MWIFLTLLHLEGSKLLSAAGLTYLFVVDKM